MRPPAYLAVALATACAHEGLRPPTQGGPAWFELESKHFTLRTDEGESEGRRLLEKLELIYAALNRVLSLTFEAATVADDQIEVTAFAHPEDFETVTRRTNADGLQRETFDGREQIILVGHEARIVAHEI